MVWWQILGWIIAALLGLPAAIYYTLRLKSRWDENKEKQHNAVVQAKESLSHLLKYYVEEWEDVDSIHIQERIKDANTPRLLRKRLQELERRIAKYHKWWADSNYIIESLVKAEVEKREKLKNLWDYVAKAYEGMPPLEHAMKEAVRYMIYEGNLEGEKVKELLLKNRRDYSVHFPLTGTQVWADQPPEEVSKLEGVVKEPQIKLKDILDSNDFYRLVEHLKDLEHRPAVLKTTTIRESLMFKANDTLKWINKRLKKEGGEG